MEYEQFLQYRFCDTQNELEKWWNSELSKLICKFYQFSTAQLQEKGVVESKCTDLHKQIFTRVSAPLADSIQKQFPHSLRRVGISDALTSTILKQLIECYLKKGCKQRWVHELSQRNRMDPDEIAFPGLNIDENNQLTSIFHRALQEWPDDHDYDECQRILMENNQTTRVTNKALRFMIGYEALLIYYLKKYFPPGDLERREENPLFKREGFLDGFLPGFYSGICDAVINKLYREGEKIEVINNESISEEEPHAVHSIKLMLQLLQKVQGNSLSSAVKIAIFSKLCHLYIEKPEEGQTQIEVERGILCQYLQSKLDEIANNSLQLELKHTLTEFESYAAAEQMPKTELGCGSRGRPSAPLSGCRSYMWGRMRFSEPVREIWINDIDKNSSNLELPAELLTDPLPSREYRAKSKFYRIRSTYSILAVQDVSLVAPIEAIIHKYMNPEVHPLAKKVIEALREENLRN